MSTLAIAQTIRSQIHPITLMRLGLNPKTLQALPETDKALGGLTFKTLPNPNLQHHSRWEIILTPADTYTIKVYNTRNNKEIYQTEGIYCDMLDDTLMNIAG